MRAMQKGGFVDAITFLNPPYILESAAYLADSQQIVRGPGWGNNIRFDFRTLDDQHSRAIRASKGHSRHVGAVGASLPSAPNVA